MNILSLKYFPDNIYDSENMIKIWNYWKHQQTFQEMDLSQDEVGSVICTNKFAGWVSNNFRD